MCGEESILATTISVNRVNQHSDLEIVCRSQSRHKRFDELVINRSGKEYAQSCTSEDTDDASEVVVVLHHNIEQ